MTRHASSGAIEVSIVDDLTMVLRRRDTVRICTWMINTEPQHGVELLIDKCHAFAPAHPSETDPMQSPAARSLQMMGCKVLAEGLPRLLGAPIGTRVLCTRADGHLQATTNSAKAFVEKVHSLEPATAEYQMLRFFVSTAMHHLPRLMPPDLVQGFALQHCDATCSDRRHTYQFLARSSLPARV